ncbi:hypothetical protein GOV12_07765 [Candidatus Pacearchaeota archaeon]|nr:hypothetical protein [Candidatus Pacearchaeota archaeon]
MPYGNTLEDVKKNKTHPNEIQTKYGSRKTIVNEPEFSLEQFTFNSGYKGMPNISGGVLFVESGKVTITTDDLKDDLVITKQNSITIPKNLIYAIVIKEDTLCYLFSTPYFNPESIKIIPTFNHLDKYWGKIENIFSNEHLAAKRIIKNPNTKSSLEYHLNKKEAYIVQSGKIKVGLRIGRAKNHSIELNTGDVFLIPPGIMHMRLGIEQSVIIEISTKDDDSDSKLVEDGKTYVHKEESTQ